MVDNIGRAHVEGAIAAGLDVEGRASVAAAWAAPATGSNGADANEKNKKEVDVIG